MSPEEKIIKIVYEDVIISPETKARELYRQFTYYSMYKELAKEMTIVCIDEIIEALPPDPVDRKEPQRKAYWVQVKVELKKL